MCPVCLHAGSKGTSVDTASQAENSSDKLKAKGADEGVHIPVAHNLARPGGAGVNMRGVQKHMHRHNAHLLGFLWMQ